MDLKRKKKTLGSVSPDMCSKRRKEYTALSNKNKKAAFFNLKIQFFFFERFHIIFFV